MMIIKSISAKSILDSRKEKTIQISANNEKASSPSGKSKGKYETPSYKQSLNQDIKTIKIPIPLGNAIGGGLHSSNKQKPVFQEFLIIPSSSSIKNNVKIMNSVY